MIKLDILDECKTLMIIIFGMTSENPKYRYDINPQLIRSGLSIGSNISEASQKKGNCRNHLFDIALGSLEECRFQLYVYPGFVYTDQIDDLIEKIRATIIKLKRSSSSP